MMDLSPNEEYADGGDIPYPIQSPKQQWPSSSKATTVDLVQSLLPVMAISSIP
jgi:hypothetical protein